MKTTVVIGLGNPFMSDDGIGVHIVRRLREEATEFPNVDFIEAGNAAMKVLHAIAGRDVAFLIDCAYMGEPQGSMKRFSPDEVVSRKERKGVSVHESDLLAILRMSEELGELPDRTVVFAIEPSEVKPGDVLSPLLSKRLQDYVASVALEIRADHPACAKSTGITSKSVPGMHPLGDDPKHEYRNPKHETNSNAQNSNDQNDPEVSPSVSV